MCDAGSTLRTDLVSWGNGVSYFGLPPTTQESKWLLIFLNTHKNTHTRKHTRNHKTFDILEHRHILTVIRVDTNLCNAKGSQRQLSEVAVTHWVLWLTPKCWDGDCDNFSKIIEYKYKYKYKYKYRRVLRLGWWHTFANLAATASSSPLTIRYQHSHTHHPHISPNIILFLIIIITLIIKIIIIVKIRPS